MIFVSKHKVQVLDSVIQQVSLIFTDSTESNASLVAKEHFVFTDPEGQLYHFSVEGNAIKDGTKIPAEANLCKKVWVKTDWIDVFLKNAGF